MYKHQPVLLQEVIEHLAINPNGFYVDATFGRGGHTRAILSHLNSHGRLLAIDKDPSAYDAISDDLKNDPRFIFCAGSYQQLKQFVTAQDWVGKVNGILLDLGVSSPQLDDPNRGFSFLHAGPLDMRMNPTQGISAAQWLQTAKEAEIAQVLFEYGEERFARRIAHALVLERANKPITSTDHLAEVVKKANPAWEKHKHPATRAFQAIRIFINNELTELEECLDQSLEVLAIGGRLAVISFHSLEDRIVKRFMRQQEQGPKLPKGLPIRASETQIRMRKIIGPLKATEQEVSVNIRARSAILRVGEKLS